MKIAIPAATGMSGPTASSAPSGLLNTSPQISIAAAVSRLAYATHLIWCRTSGVARR